MKLKIGMCVKVLDKPETRTEKVYKQFIGMKGIVTNFTDDDCECVDVQFPDGTKMEGAFYWRFEIVHSKLSKILA